MLTAIPVTVELVRLIPQVDDERRFFVCLTILGVADGVFATSLVANLDYESPRVTKRGRDDFDLPPDLSDRFAICLYEMLRPELVGGEITASAVTLTQPDLRPWLDTLPDATALIEALSAKASTETKVLIDRPIITWQID